MEKFLSKILSRKGAINIEPAPSLRNNIWIIFNRYIQFLLIIVCASKKFHWSKSCTYQGINSIFLWDWATMEPPITMLKMWLWLLREAIFQKFWYFLEKLLFGLKQKSMTMCIYICSHMFHYIYHEGFTYKKLVSTHILFSHIYDI